MSTFSAQKQQVQDLAARGAELARAHHDEAAAKTIEQAAAALRDGKLSVAAVGEFKRGKSSLLNALIEEPGLFPVNVEVATSLVTTVAYGELEQITVYVDADDGKAEPRAVPIAREQIADYVTEQGNPDNERGARLLEIALPSEKLRDGLVFVDTPGVGGLNTQHTAVTYGFVTRADVVLFVLDALQPLTVEELEFVKTVGEHAQAVIFAVTKKDKQPDYEVIVDNTRSKVADLLGRPPDEIAIVPVSSWSKLAYLGSEDPEDLAASNFEALEAALWGVLRERGAAMVLLRALGTIQRSLDKVMGPVRAELEAYTASTEAEIEQAEAKLAADAQRAEELRRLSARWRQTLNQEWEKSQVAINNRVRSGSLAVNHELSRLVDDDALLSERPQELVGMLDRDMALLGSELSKLLHEKTAAVAQLISQETGLALNAAAPDSAIAAEAAKPELDIKTSAVVGDRTLTMLMGAGMGATAGTLGASIIGGLLASGPVGWGVLAGGALLGAAQQAYSRMRGFEERERAKRRNAALKVLKPYVDDSLADLSAQMQNILVQTKHALAASFDSMLLEEQERLRDAQAAVKAARNRSKEQRAARAAELRRPLSQIQQARKQVDALTQAVLSASAEAGPRTVAVGAQRGDFAEV